MCVCVCLCVCGLGGGRFFFLQSNSSSFFFFFKFWFVNPKRKIKVSHSLKPSSPTRRTPASSPKKDFAALLNGSSPPSMSSLSPTRSPKSLVLNGSSPASVISLSPKSHGSRVVADQSMAQLEALESQLKALEKIMNMKVRGPLITFFKKKKYIYIYIFFISTLRTSDFRGLFGFSLYLLSLSLSHIKKKKKKKKKNDEIELRTENDEIVEGLLAERLKWMQGEFNQKVIPLGEGECSRRKAPNCPHKRVKKKKKN